MDEWYIIDRTLFEKEIKIAKQNLRNFFYFGDDKKDTLYFFGYLSVDDIGEEISITFPSIYPLIPPKVFIWENYYQSKIKEFPDKTHNNWDGSICIFTSDWGLDSWHNQMNLENVFDRTKEWIRKSRNKTHIDEHSSIIHMIPGNYSSYREDYFDIFSLKDIVNNDFFCKPLTILKIDGNSKSRIYFSSNFSENEIIENYSKNYNIKLEHNKEKAIIVKFPFSIIEFREKLTESGNFNSFLQEWKIEIDDNDYLIPIFNDLRIPDCSIDNSTDFNNHLTYTFMLKNQNLENTNSIPIIKVFSLNLKQDIFQRTQDVLKDQREKIKSSIVLFLGLGTLGSQIAIELGKLEFKKFILYDFDLLQPANICRHIGGVKDIGDYKVNIVQNRLKENNPTLEVDPYPENPFQNKSKIEKFLSIIQDVDLIINTTASYQTDQVLNELAWNNNVNVIYGRCSPNAKSGRVFRVIPKITPCYNCIDIQLESQPDIYPRIVDSFEKNETPQFIGYRQPGIPGISIDINFISLLIAKLSLQTITNDQLYPTFTGDHFIWNNQEIPEIQIFSKIGIETYNFQKIPRCSVCKQIKRRNNPQKNKEILKIKEISEKNFKRWIKNEKVGK